MKSISKRALVQSAFTVAAMAALPSFAQSPDEPRQPMPVVGGNVLTLKCCHCTGEANTYPLHTGVAPWKLTSGPTSLVNPPHSLWTLAPPGQWIGPGAAAGQSAPPGTYTYQLRIIVPKCIIPSTVTIKGRYWGDDEAYISASGATGSSTPAKGPPPPPYTSPGGWGFITGNAGSFNFTVPAGPPGSGPTTVVLTIRVPNLGKETSPTGLLVNGLVTQQCATDRPGPDNVDPPIDKKE